MSSAGAPDTIAIEHDTWERTLRVVVFGTPPLALAMAGWWSWGDMLHWHDLVVLAITYTLTGLGVTVGYHRLFTHRSFKTGRCVRALLAVLGSMAVEGPVIDWVATHRKHHRYSDQPGDPHSPHVDRAPGWRGSLRGLTHAHIGWIFRGKDCFGRRPFTTGDESRNLAWLAPIAFGEAWHNNHHAFPVSARHGLGRWQLDPAAGLISALERCHLAWDVIRITPARQQDKRARSA